METSTMESLKKTFPLPFDRTVTFEFFPPTMLGTEVTPDLPSFADRDDTLEFLAAYVEARRAFIECVAAVTGQRIAIIDELPDGREAIGQTIAPPAQQ
jgi:hypothetical protein